MIFWATSLLQERANWTSWSFELLLYFRNVPTGLNDLLSYFSETCQLDFMIFWATSLLQERANWTWWSFELLLYFRDMPTGIHDLWGYFSETCQLDFMIFWATSLLQERANWTWWSFEPLLYFRNVPTGLNDLSVKVCNSEFLHETFDNVFINIFIDILIYIYIYYIYLYIIYVIIHVYILCIHHFPHVAPVSSSCLLHHLTLACWDVGHLGSRTQASKLSDLAPATFSQGAEMETQKSRENPWIWNTGVLMGINGLSQYNIPRIDSMKQ